MDGSDADRVQAARGGDAEAFSHLVGRHERSVWSLVLRLIGDRAAAEEVVQDVFLAAWRGLSTFRGEARFDTWLRRIALNKARNARTRFVRRAGDRHDALEDAPPEALATPGVSPEGAVARRWDARRVEAALATLEDEHREILLLRDMQDLDYETIGDLLELPPGTVRSRLHRARVALARALTLGPKTRAAGETR